MKAILKFFYIFFSTFFFNPFTMFKKWRGIPIFLRNIILYNRKNKGRFKIKFVNLMPMLLDRFESAGSAQGHYFFQDLWASNFIYKNDLKEVVDVASRIDGYVAHILPFCKVTYIDIREINAFHPNFSFKKGSILELPFEDNSIELMSCLHVIEHIGLGRYGDEIDCEGHLKSAKELMRVLKPGGKLLLGTPVGKEKLYFDAHRVFNPQTIVEAFNLLKLEEFSLIDDKCESLNYNSSIEDALNCKYGCGLFVFSKNF